MIVRRVTGEELRFIKSYAPIVQQEATLGYMNGNSLVMNEEMIYFHKAEYLALFDHHRICGWILVGETNSPVEPDPIGMILELFVLPSYRKKGCGHTLMTNAISYFKQKNYKKVQLNVFAGNHAKKLYDQLGFKAVSTIMERPI
ncbi:GNAT family N-acetyltransferase [Alkalihalobacillus sp. MEB130]|uniref:GNAT family N-acetyltransferase n=1 Tax=Alkalihalobacillus sp. MEB130 TaxID=2976704 RepID=UPI0028DD5EFD|nr:GNAT family N-acetyltransferase [Alkalihalobacillus sp. MEB130]MDT8861936.1 GNAT family N-acetyltransferase [Alkalihalobacillus sp. MEB130]